MSAVLFIDGNHENFDILEEFPLVEWNGGLVHEIDSGIISLNKRPGICSLKRKQNWHIVKKDEKKLITSLGTVSFEKTLLD